MGTNTQIVVSVDAAIAPPTPFAPSAAAFLTVTPSLRSRYMFSITTMELSTSIPMPSARPERDTIFIVICEKYISTIAKITLKGIEHAMINVDLKSFRNSIRIIIASAAPISIF